jgi:hypothetical protein
LLDLKHQLRTSKYTSKYNYAEIQQEANVGKVRKMKKPNNILMEINIIYSSNVNNDKLK